LGLPKVNESLANLCQAAMGEAKIVEFQILSQVFTNEHGQESATCCGEMRGKLGRLKKHMIAMYRNENRV